MVMDVSTILNILDHEFPSTKGELLYQTPFQLLIAVMLSAQTTDAAVNKVTPQLFSEYPDAFAMANANVKDIEKYINTIGLYRNKARFAVNCAQILVEKYNGEVPQTRKALMDLPGVGRKTANVVLSEGFKIPAIAVDTHIERVAKRLKLAKPNDSVLKVEEKLMRKIPREDWGRAHLLLLLFGRYYSTARNQEDAYKILERLKEKHGL